MRQRDATRGRGGRLTALFGAATLVGVVAAGCGQGASLVGGECASGYTQCGLACVDVENDPAHCGSCDNACPTGATCAMGTCSVLPAEAGADAGADADGGDGAAYSEAGDADDATLNDGGDASDADATVHDDGGDAGEDSTALDSAEEASPSDAPSTTDATDAPGDVTSDVGTDGQSDAADGSPAEAAVNDGATESSIDTGPDACVPPYDTAQQCGSCFTPCNGPNMACVATNSGYACVLSCSPPLTQCGQVCVDEQDDPNNCGTCAKKCLSNLCSGGLCQGVTPGDDVIIGHDFATAVPGSAQARVLTNAVFLPTSNPLRVLSFEHYANVTAVANAKMLVTSAAAAQGKAVQITVSTTDSDIPSKLTITSFDVLLVYDQANATTGTLATLGASWASTLATYLQAGGDVVTLDGAQGTVQEMPQFLSNAGLLAVSAHTTVTPGTALDVVGPANSVGQGVLSPYGAGQDTARFTTSEQNSTTTAYIVIEPVSGTPVVIQKTIF